MSLPTRVGRHGQAGTALVEFAILLPLVALISFGAIDLGRAFRAVNEVRNAAREGAAHAQLNPSRLAGLGCTTPDTAQWHARNEGGSGGTTLAIDVSTPGGTFSSADAGCAPLAPTASRGQSITFTVSRPFNVLTPFVRAVTGNPTIRSSVTVRVQ
ncbi:MAG: TadE/TadG family type IV pilus assembly protein [Actinomycetota bacterium]|jgi:Flp pilus assembly protein TadG